MTEISVVKFGGSSFLDLADYDRVAGYLDRLSAGDTRVVAVVSGMSGTTGRLLEAARTVDPDLEPAVQDQILATAEIVGAGLLRAALHARGTSATDLCAHQIGIRSDESWTRARIVDLDAGPVLSALADHRVVVVAGGQAVDRHGRITMLGRNSSDLTAVALAAAVGAPDCEIFSDVAGIFTADPHVVPAALLLPSLSYAQTVAMAESGAKVLHWGSVTFAADHGVRIVCRSLTAGPGGDLVAGPGTVVGLEPGRSAVVGDRRAEVFQVLGDVSPVLAAVRARGLVANRVDVADSVDDGTVVAFPGGQSGVGLVLAESGARVQPITGIGLVTVVAADGRTHRRAVGLDEVDHAVRAAHVLEHGASLAPAAVLPGPKRRSPYSGLLSGAAVAGSC